MLIFLGFLIALFLGYKFYGSYIEKVFGPDEKRVTPAYQCRDNVDFMPLPKYKIFLIQFLNIAGLGPVYGTIFGAVYGPACLWWILLGSIFGGAVHDYFSGMLSVRQKGESCIYVIEKQFGKYVKYFFLIFLVLLLVLVGAVFATGPATMLAGMTPNINFLKNFSNTPSLTFWLTIIFLYYFLSTYLPIDKIIAKIYPFFGLTLILVTIGLGFSILQNGDTLYKLSLFKNLHPTSEPMFPILFITIACGAISGFHATQSPLMSRCLKNEKDGKQIFYGAMITEAVVGLIWACVGICFYKDTASLQNVISVSGPNGVIKEISSSYLGTIGGIFTVLSVVFLSITSGDTAFRSARITIADCFKINQKNKLNRLVLSSIVLGTGIYLSLININELWKYFGWANQTLAAIILWTTAVYLKVYNKNYFVALLPVLFMTTVCVSYLLYTKIGFNLNIGISINYALIVSALLGIIFFVRTSKK